jgi:hypothetical protein
MGATAVLPVRSYQRPCRARPASSVNAAAPQPATAARVAHETDTKTHGFYMVFTWFLHGFPRLRNPNPLRRKHLRRRKKFCFCAAPRTCQTNPPCTRTPAIRNAASRTQPDPTRDPLLCILAPLPSPNPSDDSCFRAAGRKRNSRFSFVPIRATRGHLPPCGITERSHRAEALPSILDTARRNQLAVCPCNGCRPVRVQPDERAGQRSDLADPTQPQPSLSEGDTQCARSLVVRF